MLNNALPLLTSVSKFGMGAILMPIGLPELIIILPLLWVLLGTIFWIWMLIDCATKESNPNDKVVWILIMVVTPLIGAVIYFFVRRRKRIA